MNDNEIAKAAVEAVIADNDAPPHTEVAPTEGSPEQVQILKDAGDLTSAVAFVSDIPEPAYEALVGNGQPIIGVADTRSVRARRWSRLETITIRNFKATQEAVIPLGQVTILVGPNGSGKSSVLQAVHWAARSASYIAPKNTTEMISFERLDYVPSSEPLRTAHKI